MTVLENVSEILQINTFIFGILLGGIFSFIYITFYQSIIKLPVKINRIVFIIFDVLFLSFISVITHFYLILVCYGKIRFYIIFSEIIGFLLFKFTLGIIVKFLIDKVLMLIQNIILFPLWKMINMIMRFICRNLLKIKLFIKKPQKVVKKT